jgi:DNA-binding response OmpR family regulator
MSRVLVVDDDAQIRRMLEMWLARDGHEVVLAGDGNAAMDAVSGALGRIDVVITDIVMPDKEGLELIMELKKQYWRLPIIAISGGGYLSPYSYLNMAKMLKADRTFRKPLDMKEVLAAVRELAG